MLKYIKRGLIVGMLALVFLVLAYLLGVKTYDAPKKEKTQVYERDSSIFRSTATSRLSSFESTLKSLQDFGGGEVIFQGGKGFVRFRVRKDGSLVAKVPALCIGSTHLIHHSVQSHPPIKAILHHQVNLLGKGTTGTDPTLPKRIRAGSPISKNRPAYIPRGQN